MGRSLLCFFLLMRAHFFLLNFDPKLLGYSRSTKPKGKRFQESVINGIIPNSQRSCILRTSIELYEKIKRCLEEEYKSLRTVEVPDYNMDYNIPEETNYRNELSTDLLRLRLSLGDISLLYREVSGFQEYDSVEGKCSIWQFASFVLDLTRDLDEYTQEADILSQAMKTVVKVHRVIISFISLVIFLLLLKENNILLIPKSLVIVIWLSVGICSLVIYKPQFKAVVNHMCFIFRLNGTCSLGERVIVPRYKKIGEVVVKNITDQHVRFSKEDRRSTDLILPHYQMTGHNRVLFVDRLRISSVEGLGLLKVQNISDGKSTIISNTSKRSSIPNLARKLKIRNNTQHIVSSSFYILMPPCESWNPAETEHMIFGMDFIGVISPVNISLMDVWSRKLNDMRKQLPLELQNYEKHLHPVIECVELFGCGSAMLRIRFPGLVHLVRCSKDSDNQEIIQFRNIMKIVYEHLSIATDEAWKKNAFAQFARSNR